MRLGNRVIKMNSSWVLQGVRGEKSPTFIYHLDAQTQALFFPEWVNLVGELPCSHRDRRVKTGLKRCVTPTPCSSKRNPSRSTYMYLGLFTSIPPARWQARLTAGDATSGNDLSNSLLLQVTQRRKKTTCIHTVHPGSVTLGCSLCYQNTFRGSCGDYISFTSLHFCL